MADTQEEWSVLQGDGASSPTALSSDASKTAATPEGGDKASTGLTADEPSSVAADPAPVAAAPAAATTTTPAKPAMASVAPNAGAAATTSCPLCEAFKQAKPVLIWTDPATTGAIFVSCLLVFSMFFYFEVSTFMAAAYCAFFALAVAGIAKVASSRVEIPSRLLPSTVAHADFQHIREGLVKGADDATHAVVQGYVSFRGYLTWESPVDSVRALACAWLAARMSWLVCPTTLFFVIVLLFSLPLAYETQKAQIEGVINGSVKPISQMVGAHAHNIRSKMSSTIAMAAFALFPVFWYLGLASFTCWLTLSAWIVVGLESLPALRAKTE